MKLKTLAVMVLCLAPLSSFASDGDITFNGEVTAAACTFTGFNNGSTTTGAVMVLPSVTPTSFSGAGGYAGMQDFTIELKNCSTSTLHNAQVSFSGTPDALDNSILSNIAGTTPASGVGIALLENDGATPISINGGAPAQAQALVTGDNSLKFKVAYKANTSTPAVTAGKVSAKTFIDIAYN
ncbi:fimbrial protein [Rahnella ecdela]|uniref:Type 1 fimbrial protein n=1 Tax=Rahnella ecdela TaxID=2816250 RepID=A0ABS6LBJ1_9GAMM|nr:fimbrial protein [Rahnella ecdela]MBU9843874.1 type 1 fimbrial protein [Rahnella ecdela]